MLSPRSVFITGANRGLGLEFVRQFLELPQPPAFLFAACRNPDSAVELKELASRNQTLTLVQLDVTSDSDIESAFQVTRKTLKGHGLNLLLNNAGVNLMPWEEKFSTMEKFPLTRDHVLSTFDANVAGPVLLVQKFLPLLKQAAEERKDESVGCNRAAVVNISSFLSSISSAAGGKFMYAYRSSKTALNMATRVMSLDFKPYGILAICVDPGHAKTELGGGDALITPQDSISACLKTLSKVGEAKNGLLFRSSDGSVIPW